jgi:hypothetical protein
MFWEWYFWYHFEKFWIHKLAIWESQKRQQECKFWEFGMILEYFSLGKVLYRTPRKLWQQYASNSNIELDQQNFHMFSSKNITIRQSNPLFPFSLKEYRLSELIFFYQKLPIFDVLSQTFYRMSSLCRSYECMNIARVNIGVLIGWKKIKQRRISFVLGYLRVLNTILCDHKACQWLAAGWWFSLGTPVSSTHKKTDRHDITEILLKVALKAYRLSELIWMYEYCAGKHCSLDWMEENQTATYFLRFRLFTYDFMKNINGGFSKLCVKIKERCYTDLLHFSTPFFNT